jgi:thiamine biosynthesis lipoprotein
MGVTLNGIAQGFATDEVKRVLRSRGIEHALINMGEWSAMGRSPRNTDWMIGVASPTNSDALLARLQVRDACVATSADDQTTFSNDHVHHHIFDPHTGYSPRDVSSVTVIAPTCIQADALTKVLFVAGFERAIALADQWQVQALVVSKSGECQMTKGLPVV